MKDPCSTREQSILIHDVVNNQSFKIGHFEVLWSERIDTAMQKDGLTSFLMLNVLEEKIFQYGSLEGHDVWENNLYWSSTKRNVVAIMESTKPEILVVKDEMLVEQLQNTNLYWLPYRSQFRALEWLLKYCACVMPAALWKERTKLALFSFFWRPSLIFAGFQNGEVSLAETL